MLRTNTGQALLESVIALGGMMIIGSALLALMAPLYAQLWVRHSVYEGLICLAEQKSQVNCRQLAKSRIRTAVPFATPTLLQLNKSFSGYVGHYRVSLPLESSLQGVVHMPTPRPQRGSY